MPSTSVKTGDHGDLSGGQGLLDPGGDHQADPGVTVPGIAEDPGLPAGEGSGLSAQALDADGHQGGRLLLAGGGQGVQLPGIGMLRQSPGPLQQLIGAVSGGGDHGHHPVSPAPGLQTDPGGPPQALRIRQGAAAEFLYDQHDCSSHGRSLRPLHPTRKGRRL